jgi:hypothetical protein
MSMNAFSARRTIAIQALSELTIPAVCVVMFALFSRTERGGTLPASVSPHAAIAVRAAERSVLMGSAIFFPYCHR